MPDGAQHVRAGALHEFQIIGIIDDPGGVGVLEIDGQREAVLAADEAAAIGLVEGEGSIAPALTIAAGLAGQPPRRRRNDA
jgi:hypothetical protein